MSVIKVCSPTCWTPQTHRPVCALWWKSCRTGTLEVLVEFPVSLSNHPNMTQWSCCPSPALLVFEALYGRTLGPYLFRMHAYWKSTQGFYLILSLNITPDHMLLFYRHRYFQSLWSISRILGNYTIRAPWSSINLCKSWTAGFVFCVWVVVG